MHPRKACFPAGISKPFLCSVNTPRDQEADVGSEAYGHPFPGRFCVLKTPYHTFPEQPRGQNHISESLLSNVYIRAVFVFCKHSYYTFYPLNPLSKSQWKMFTAK